MCRARTPSTTRTQQFDLHNLWLDNKFSLPLHYAVYIAEVGCKKVAAANVESVFSGAGKFTLEAKATGAVYLRQIVKVHNNWKYLCLRPTEEAIIARYMLKHGNISAPSAAPPSTSPDPSSSDAAASTAPSSGSAGPSTSGHAADPPSADPLGGVDMSLLQRAGVLQNTPYAA